MPLTVFRFDASPLIGGGHGMRCLALALALIENGVKVSVAVSSQSLAVLPTLVCPDFTCFKLDCAPDQEPDVLAGQNADLLVIDHYGRGLAYERRCRTWARRILVIDDLANREHDCDFLLDPTPGRTSSDYCKLVPRQCKLMLGPMHSLLRSEFPNLREAALKRRLQEFKPRRLLISFGLTDAANLAGRVLDALYLAQFKGGVDILLGSYAPSLPQVQSIISRRPDWKLHVDATNVGLLMRDADLAIGAPGTTIWEMCCLGLPAITIETADNQGGNCRWLDINKVSWHLGRQQDFDAGKLITAVSELWGDSTRRREFTQRGAAACDGGGAKRLANALLCPLTSLG